MSEQDEILNEFVGEKNPGPIIPDDEVKKQDLTPRKRRRSGLDLKIGSNENREAGYETSDESGNSFFLHFRPWSHDFRLARYHIVDMTLWWGYIMYHTLE